MRRSRLPLAAFAALAAATVAAFFVTQHLKVSTPLIAGFPKPSPEYIAPAGAGCGGTHRYTRLSFYLLHRADDVAVYIVDTTGAIVRTLASNRHMRRKVRYPDGVFNWDGRTDAGRIAPDGIYHYRIALLHQGRTIELRDPVVVQDKPPRPVVRSVSPNLLPYAGGRALIHVAGHQSRGGVVRLYRTDLPGPPHQVKTFRALFAHGEAQWDGRIRLRPAPAGVYLAGLKVADQACNVGVFPRQLPPSPGSTPGAGITVRYLAAEPPLTPVPAGSAATVLVDSRRQPYSWTLTPTGGGRPVGSGSGRSVSLRVPLPGRRAGLYVLTLHSGAHRVNVPLVASAGEQAPRRPRVLVVLPALTWQGFNPVDDDGDGVPNTLSNGGPVKLARVFGDGLPVGFGAEAALLAWLDRARLSYDLTTDLALAQGAGPVLSGGAVLAGEERWVPSGLAASLVRYVRGGGQVLSLGSDSLVRSVTLRNGRAVDPSGAANVDVLGARPAAVRPNHDLLTVSSDGLGLFSGTAGALSGFRLVQPFTPGPGVQFASSLVTASGGAVVAGYRVGNGAVVEVGLPGLGGRVARNVGAQELLRRLWQVLGG